MINFWEVLKSCSIISLSVFILANQFDTILKFTLLISSICNVFLFSPFFFINNNWKRQLINLIGQLICRSIAEQIKIENIINLHWLQQLQLNQDFVILRKLIRLSILWSSFFDGGWVVKFLVNNKTLSPLIYDITF